MNVSGFYYNQKSVQAYDLYFCESPIFLPIFRTVYRKLTIKGLRDQVSKWFCGVGSVLGYTHTHGVQH
jgi:hypothetical protein